MEFKKIILPVTLLIMIEFLFGFQTIVKVGVGNDENIYSGFAFYNGKYIEAPYQVESHDLSLFINGIQVTQALKCPPKDLRVDTDPGMPFGVSSMAGLAALDTVRGLNGHTHMFLKVKYLYQHFPKDEAKEKIIEYFKALPYIKNAEEIHKYILKVEDHYGATRLISISSADISPPPTREEFDADIENARDNVILYLKKGYCLLYFDNGKIMFSGIKAAKVLPKALKTLRNEALEVETKKQILEELSIVQRNNIWGEILINNFEATPQINTRLEKLRDTIIKRNGTEILKEIKESSPKTKDIKGYQYSIPSSPGTAYSPDGIYLHVYYVNAWQRPYNTEINSISNNIIDQNYNTTLSIWMDLTDDDDDPGSCTLSNWIGCKDADILSIHSHGGEGFFGAIYLKTSSAVDNWRGTENNILTVQSSTQEWGTPPNTYSPYFALVRKQWATDNWNSILTQSKAIVFVNCCHGNEQSGGTSFLTCCGGGAGFGYPDECDWSDRSDNNNELLQRMNGTKDSGEYRIAGEAYIHMPSHKDNMEIEPSGAELTLCPATEEYYPEDGDVVENSGAGYFQVDTYCHDDVPADEALTFATTGNVIIDNIHWVGSGQANRIEFDWDGIGHFEVTVTANADKFHSWGAATSSYHELDGDGVAPNGDDVEFTFSSTGGVDVALVIDRSGSMGSYGYMEPAKDAAKTFVGLMEIGDNVAVVSFSTDATINFALTTIESDATKTDAQNAISSINSTGSTSIGAGMQAGQGELNKGNTSVHQGMVLLSDGYENTSPMVADILPTIPENTDIYTIALGPDSDQELLNDIANETGGFYSYSPGSSDLQAIYNAIRANVTGEQVIASASGLVNQGQTVSEAVQIDGSVSKAKFSVTWAGSDVDLALTDPNGQIIDPQAAENDPNISFTSGDTYEYFNVQSPAQGEWQMNITGVDIPAGGEQYNTSVSGSATLKMEIYFDKPEYVANEPIIISAEIKETSTPITGANVSAEVTAPTTTTLSARARHDNVENIDAKERKTWAVADVDNGSDTISYAASTLQLYDDGAHGDGAANDGIYANSYLDTGVSGSYSINVTSSGASPQGGDFTREATKSTVVSNKFRIKGIVNYYSQAQPVADVEITAQCSDTDIDWTNEFGSYQVKVPSGTVEVIPTKENDLQGTISGSDAVLILQYLAFITSFSDGQEVAGDVTEDGNVTGSDAQAILRYLAFYGDNIGNTGQWTFRDINGDATSVFAVSNNISDADFTAYVLGDPTGGWGLAGSALLANAGLNSGTKQNQFIEALSFADSKSIGKKEIRVPIHVNSSGVNSILFSMDYNASTLEFKSAQTTALTSDFMIAVNDAEEGKIHLAMAGAKALQRSGDVINLIFKIKESALAKGARLQFTRTVINDQIVDANEAAIITSAELSELVNLPSEYSLSQNYPNPFNPSTTISYSVPTQAGSGEQVILRIYNIEGRLVRTLVDAEQAPGYYSVQWNGQNDNGNAMASGMYVYTISIGEFKSTRKMLYMK